jgi:excisionase family DNA binding protein
MSMPPGKTTFTLAEAADLLSCHRETLRRAIRSGDLRAAKLGRGLRISRFDLEAFWTASGGGDLFGKEQDGSSERETAQPAPKTRRKKSGQMQLSLPVEGGTRQETPDQSSHAAAGEVMRPDPGWRRQK